MAFINNNLNNDNLNNDNLNNDNLNNDNSNNNSNNDNSNNDNNKSVIISNFSNKRLLHDYRDFLKNYNKDDYKFMNIVPLENNIYEWHGNFAPQEGIFRGLVIHFILLFPNNYPCDPPKIKLLNSIPHSNIIPNFRNDKYFLCLDLINNFFWMNQGTDESRPFSGWSSSYTVETILNQLYVFLFDPTVENYDGKIKRTIYELPPELGGGERTNENLKNEYNKSFDESKKITCSCGHTFNQPFPMINKVNRKKKALKFKKNYIVRYYDKNEYSVLKSKFITNIKDIHNKFQNVNNNSNNCNNCVIISNIDEIKKSENEVDYDNSNMSLFCSLSDMYYKFLIDNKDILSNCKFMDHLTNSDLNDSCMELINTNLKVKYDKSFIKILVNITNSFYHQNIKNVCPRAYILFNKYDIEIIAFIKKYYRIYLKFYDDSELLTQNINEFINNCFDNIEKLCIKNNNKLFINKIPKYLVGFLFIHKYYFHKIYCKIVSIYDNLSDKSYLPSCNCQYCNSKFSNIHLSMCALYMAVLGNYYNYNKELRIINDNENQVYVTIVNNNNNDTFGNQIHNYLKYIKTTFNSKYNKNILFSDFLIGLLTTHSTNEQVYQLLEKYNYNIDFTRKNNINICKIIDNDKIISNIDNCDNKKIEVDIIPNEIWGKIFKYLNITQISKLLGLSQKLDSIIKSPYYNQRRWLTCFYTKMNFESTILGYPISINIFPDTCDIKEINTTLDIISYTAYKDLNINKTIWNQEFVFWLPLYINESHFDKSCHILLEQVYKISNNYDNNYYKESPSYLRNKKKILNNSSNPNKIRISNCHYLLNIFTNIMNCFIVKMMKGEMHISIKALEGLCQIYRLFSHIKIIYPEISEIADKNIYNFIHKVQYRHKTFTPNLGLILMTTLISNKYNWSHLKKTYLDESADRQILWILKALPIEDVEPNILTKTIKELNDKKLLNIEKLNIINDYIYYSDLPDIEKTNNLTLLDLIFEITKVGKKLLLFNNFFIENISNMEKIVEKLDSHYGYPNEDILKKFKINMNKIYQLKNEDEFNKYMNLYKTSLNLRSERIIGHIASSNKKNYNKQVLKNKNKNEINTDDKWR